MSEFCASNSGVPALWVSAAPLEHEAPASARSVWTASHPPQNIRAQALTQSGSSGTLGVVWKPHLLYSMPGDTGICCVLVCWCVSL